MSGVIPEINDSEVSYCIWYPESPPQETLRNLVKLYPNMIYHAARACAVAGYFDLYSELQILLEVHVAAEARDTSLARKNKGSEAIYEQIMSKHVKFEIMNYYDRSVNLENPHPAHLNGDTAVFLILLPTCFMQEWTTAASLASTLLTISSGIRKSTIRIATSTSLRTWESTIIVAVRLSLWPAFGYFCIRLSRQTFHQ